MLSLTFLNTSARSASRTAAVRRTSPRRSNALTTLASRPTAWTDATAPKVSPTKSVTRPVASRSRRRTARMVGRSTCVSTKVSASGTRMSAVIVGSMRNMMTSATTPKIARPQKSTQFSTYWAMSSTSSRNRLIASDGESGSRRVPGAVSRCANRLRRIRSTSSAQ
jgi:hypothetical protein